MSHAVVQPIPVKVLSPSMPVASVSGFPVTAHAFSALLSDEEWQALLWPASPLPQDGGAAPGMPGEAS